jgi:hypothetical protein
VTKRAFSQTRGLVIQKTSFPTRVFATRAIYGSIARLYGIKNPTQPAIAIGYPFAVTVYAKLVKNAMAIAVAARSANR